MLSSLLGNYVDSLEFLISSLQKNYLTHRDKISVSLYTGYVATIKPAPFSNVIFCFKQCTITNANAKAISVQAWTGPWDSRCLGLPKFPDSRHMKLTRLSALHTGRLYLPGNTVIIYVRG
jgi:hypothetical protein